MSLRSFHSWVVCGLLLGLCPNMATAGVPPVAVLVPSVLPDSIRLKILARLAQGDIAGAIALWQAHTGRTDIPKILMDLQLAFQVTNRRMGSCEDVARSIHSGFSQNVVLYGEPIIQTVTKP